MTKSRLPVFALRLSELRGDRTQADFADLLGISRASISLYESGARTPDGAVLRKIGEKLNVSCDYLLGISDDPALKTDPEHLDSVRFAAEVSESRYGCCDGCHRCSRVIRLSLPSTLYHDRKNLSTRYYERWFCRACADKLLEALAPACAEIREAEKEDE